MTTLLDLIENAASAWSDRTAVEFDKCGTKISFAQLHEQTGNIAGNLVTLGLAPGDRVGVCMANSPQYPLSWFGILKAGGIIVPLNIAYRSEDALHICEVSQIKFLICDAERAELFQSLRSELPQLENIFVTGRENNFETLLQSSPTPVDVRPASHDTTNLQFTSGTTGLPKGCVLTHRYWIEMIDAIRREVMEITPQDVMLTAQTFSYIDPQWALALCLRSGAKLVVLERFRPSEFWAKIAHYDATFFYCLAAMPLMMLSVPPSPAEKQHRVRAAFCSAIPAARHKELEQRFDCPWTEGYGSTETGSDVRVPLAEHLSYVGSGSIGTPYTHREVDIVDDEDRSVGPGTIGELVVRGPGMMRGYWQMPDETAKVFRNGWYHSGDLATQDEKGRITLVGRKRDVIRRAGENIAAVELETVLQQHPAVELSACVPVPDPIRNEEVMALVITREAVDIAELVAFMEERLAAFKVPRYWKIVLELPLTPSARIAKPKISRIVDETVFDRRRQTETPAG